MAVRGVTGIVLQSLFEQIMMMLVRLHASSATPQASSRPLRLQTSSLSADLVTRQRTWVANSSFRGRNSGQTWAAWCFGGEDNIPSIEPDCGTRLVAATHRLHMVRSPISGSRCLQGGRVDLHCFASRAVLNIGDRDTSCSLLLRVPTRTYGRSQPGGQGPKPIRGPSLNVLTASSPW